MTRTTFVFAAFLIALGAAGFVGTGSQHYTALIPAALGVLLAVCAAVAVARPPARKHAMHAALTLALLGLLGTLSGVFNLIRLAMGQTTTHPAAAVIAQSIMCALCALYLAIGIRSFIAARRASANV